MPEEMSLGEISRNITRLDASLNAAREQSVPLAVWDAEHRSVLDKLHLHEKNTADVLRRLERDVEELRRDHERDMEKLRASVNKRFEEQARARKQKSEFGWSRGVSIAVALATIIGVIVAAYAASKGVH